MPVIMIDQRLCKKCSICAEFCPEGIPDPSIESYNSTRCKLCKLCELYCPEFAISVCEDSVNAVNTVNAVDTVNAVETDRIMEDET